MNWLFDAPWSVTETSVEADAAAALEAADNAQRAWPAASRPMLLLATLAVIAALYVAREMIIPIVLSVLLALLLMPLVRRLQAFHLPDIASAAILILVVILLFGAAVITLAGQAQDWLANTPTVLNKVSRLVPSEEGPLKHFREATAAVHGMTQPNDGHEPLQVEVTSQDMIYAALGVSTHFVASAVIVFVLAFFLLAFNKTLRRQIVESRASFNEKRNVVQLLRNIESGVSRYLFTVTVINCGLGLASAILLWFLDVPSPLLWGALVTTSNFIPHVGAFVCMAVLFLVGAVSHESIAYGLMTAGAFAILTSLESYFVTPLVLSRSLQLSPLAIILSILFWGWLWGIAGALMAAPLLAIFKITCDQFESLHQWSPFLAGEGEGLVAGK